VVVVADAAPLRVIVTPDRGLCPDVTIPEIEAVAVPFNTTSTAGALGSFEGIESAALFGPAIVGENATSSVHVCEGTRV
jgi:hypothetical protein